MTAMRVFVSAQFLAYSSPKVRDDLINAFKWWKATPDREYLSPFFGRDLGTIAPKVNGKDYLLRHCHLIPLNDPPKLRQWEKSLRWKSEKKSDRILLYVQRGDDFFLIDVVDDPGAHQVMKMVDSKGRSFMHKCAADAGLFFDGVLQPQIV